jgi:hypothetical protein
MSERVVYNVIHKQGAWHVVKAGTNATEGRFKDKVDAIARARNLAMHEDVGEVRIVKLDGSIQSEQTFGRDPHRVEG